jgi:Ca-activated chloride channel family protein
MHYRFDDPIFIWLLFALAPLLVWRFLRRRQGKPAIRFSWNQPLRSLAQSVEWTQTALLVVRVLAITFLLLALSRPQSGMTEETVTTQGIDIVLVLDISSSMLAEDITPNRVEAAKEVAARFVEGRVNDRIGLVAFAGEAFTQCPLTLDYGILDDLIQQIEVGMIQDGTAIGMGLAVAVNRLRESDAQSRVAVLLTDGKNNRGEIDPRMAADLAESFGVRVYTIGAGTRGTAPYPVDDPLMGRRTVPVEVDIDEDMLRTVADKTGGRYFRATDRESLQEIYGEIDQLEKTEIEVSHFTRYSEMFHYPLAIALLLLGAEWLLKGTRFRRIP